MLQAMPSVCLEIWFYFHRRFVGYVPVVFGVFQRVLLVYILTRSGSTVSYLSPWQLVDREYTSPTAGPEMPPQGRNFGTFSIASRLNIVVGNKAE